MKHGTLILGTNVTVVQNGTVICRGSNLIGTAGLTYYGQKATGATPTNTFAVLELASAGTPGAASDRSDFTMIGSTEQAFTATYPKLDDDDTDNATDAGPLVCTYLSEYAAGDFTAASVTHGIITVATPGASAPILCGWAFASPFSQSANDSLKVFVNHTLATA